MKRIVYLLLLAGLVCPVAARAQADATLTVPMKDALERVLSEIPTKLKRLRGELLVNNPGSVDYVSLLQLQGAENCVVSVFSLPNDTTAGWMVDVSTTEEFVTAKKKFKELYEILKTTRLTRLNPGVSYKLVSVYLEPTEDKQSNSIEFSLSPNDKQEFTKVRVQMIMTYLMPEWHLSLQVYEKPRDPGTADDDDAETTQ